MRETWFSPRWWFAALPTLVAILDTNVLFPMLPRDTLLRVAVAGCFRSHWPPRILEEMTRNLVSDYGMDPSRAPLSRVAIPRLEGI